MRKWMSCSLTLNGVFEFEPGGFSEDFGFGLFQFSSLQGPPDSKAFPAIVRLGVE